MSGQPAGVSQKSLISKFGIIPSTATLTHVQYNNFDRRAWYERDEDGRPLFKWFGVWNHNQNYTMQGTLRIDTQNHEHLYIETMCRRDVTAPCEVATFSNCTPSRWG
jgi:hypothetical protein